MGVINPDLCKSGIPKNNAMGQPAPFYISQFRKLSFYFPILVSFLRNPVFKKGEILLIAGERYRDVDIMQNKRGTC